MEIEQFAGYIKKENIKDLKRQVLSGVCMISFTLLFMIIGELFFLLLMILELIFLIVILDFSRYAWNRYLYYFEEEHKFSTRKSIIEILRMHSFNKKEYFKYINKKMIPISVMIGICSLLSGIFVVLFSGLSGSIYICIIFSIINIFSPFIVGKIKRKMWDKKIQNIRNKKIDIFLMVIERIFFSIEIGVLCAIVFVTSFFLWVLLSGLIFVNIDQTIIVLRTYKYFFSIVLWLLAIFIIILAYILQKKSIKKVLSIISVILLIAFLICFYIEANSYYEFTDYQITLKTVFKEKIYSIDDVESFVIFEQNDYVQMKIYLDDGKYALVVEGSSTYSEVYESEFYSDYNFIAYYMELLDQEGVSGEVKDVDKFIEELEESESTEPETNPVNEALEKIISYSRNNQ